MKTVNGKPRHSEPQDSVERKNQDFEKMLVTCDWAWIQIT